MHHLSDESTADLKELTTIAPMSREAHAAQLREKVVARRYLEDKREAATLRKQEAL